MLNKVVLIGRLVRDPELRYTNTNIPVVSFTLAVNRPFVSQNQNQDNNAD
ncbi:MAG: single-stranded DNA-binding protein, partial [Candidatus Izemoplasmatales bacterium]|nr:single-stranded DNA-binding protein [Candidatus Izemoplasmatales bacterium]